MAVLDEATVHRRAPALDPREPPPQILKDVFKSFQKLPPSTIATDPHILDFEKDISSYGVEKTSSISSETLRSIYGGFLGDENSFDIDVLEDQPVYTSEALPGLLILPSFLPPSIQKELLARLLHRDLSDQKHQTNVHMFYDMPYPHGTSSQDGASSENASFFSYSPKSKVTFTPKDPSVHKPLSVSKFMQKGLRWLTLGGQYDWTNKVYPDEVPPAFPADIKDLLEGVFPDVKAQAAIVNLYSPGDTLSLHRDVSEESDKGLVSISLGCACLFLVGHGRDSTDHVTVRLRSGDAVVMSKEARFAWHGVPKILADTCPEYLSSWPAEDGKYEEWRGWMRNKRVNLNVRQMFD